MGEVPLYPLYLHLLLRSRKAEGGDVTSQKGAKSVLHQTSHPKAGLFSGPEAGPFFRPEAGSFLGPEASPSGSPAAPAMPPAGWGTGFTREQANALWLYGRLCLEAYKHPTGVPRS